MLNSPRYLEFYYATAQAGVIIVPLNTRWNLDEMVFALRDSGSKLLVLDDRFVNWREPIAARLPELRYLFAGASTVPEGISDNGRLTAEAPGEPSKKPILMKTMWSASFIPAAAPADRIVTCLRKRCTVTC
jgi:long-chain acyl-CoA synthetase